MKTNNTGKDKVTVLKSLAEIGTAISKMKLSIPKWESLSGLDNIADTIQGKIQAAKKIRADMANVLKFLLDSSRQFAACKDHDERRFVTEELMEPKAKAQEYLAQVFNLKGGLRAVAAVAYFKTVLTLDYTSAEEVNMMLNGMVDRGLLTHGGNGNPITIGYLHYRISGAFGLDAGDIAEISSVVEQFSRAAKTMEFQRREALTKEMEAKAEINLDEALAGKTGMCLVYVPAEEYSNGKGSSQWRGGGYVFFHFQKDFILPLQASGAVEKLVADIAARKVQIPRHALTWKTQPGFWELVDSITRNLNLRQKEAENYAKDLLTLWHMLRRGIEHKKEAEARKKAKDEMEAKAEISSLEFFGLNGTSGGKPVEGKKALLQFTGVTRLRNGQKLFNPFFLATRMTEESKEFFEVVEIPPHLQKAFGKYIGKKLPLNDRRACPELGNLVDKIRGQQEMAAATATAK